MKLKPIKPKKIRSRASALKWFSDIKKNPQMGWQHIKVELTDDLLHDKEIVAMALETRVYTFDRLPSALKKDKEIVKIALMLRRIDHIEVRDLDELLRNDEEIAEIAIEQCGLCITNFPLALKNKKWVLYALSSPVEQWHFCTWIYRWIDYPLADDIDVITKAVGVNLNVLDFLADELEKGRDIGELLDNKEFILYALRQNQYLYRNNHSCIKQISDRLKKDKDVAIATVSKHGADIVFFDDHIKHDIDVIEAACHDDDFLKNFVFNDLNTYFAFARQYTEVIKSSCTIDISYIRYATREQRASRSYIQGVAESCAMCGTRWHGSDMVEELFEDLWKEACRSLEAE